MIKIVRNSVGFLLLFVIASIINGCSGSGGGNNITPSPTLSSTPSVGVTSTPIKTSTSTSTPVPTQSSLKEVKGIIGFVQHDNFNDKFWFDSGIQGVVHLDYAASSIGIDFGGEYLPAIKIIQLVPDKEHQNNRIDVARGIKVCYSANTTYFTLVTEWTFSKGTDGVITINLKNPIQARYLKIHSLYNDTDIDGNSVDKSTFVNELSKIIRVYE